MCCCINSVNAGEAPRSHRRVHGKHLGMSADSGYSGSLSTDLGYGGSSTASTDLGYGGLSTAATSTHSTSHLEECYQKTSIYPHAEGKLRYA